MTIKSYNNSWTHFLQLGRIPKVGGSKIDSNRLKEFHSTNPPNARGVEIAERMELVKEIQSVLSKDLLPERYNGLINMDYIFKNPNATSEEIQSVLVMS